MFCSGTFPVLQLVSSRIFGLYIFESGLLSSELRALTMIKIRCNICFENIPQLLIQIIFIRLDGVKIETMAAMTASLLSVISTVLVWWVERDLTREYEVTKYFIRLHTAGKVTEAERAAMDENKKKRRGLMVNLAAIFGAGEKQIEVGSVTMKDDGLAVHVQHLIFAKQLDRFRRQKNQYNISVEDYMESAFRMKMKNIFDAMWAHFELDKCRAQRAEYKASFLQLEMGNEEVSRPRPNIAYSDGDQIGPGNVEEKSQLIQRPQKFGLPAPADADVAGSGGDDDIAVILRQELGSMDMHRQRLYERLSALMDQRFYAVDARPELP